MTMAKQHNELVDFIMNECGSFQTQKELEEEILRRFGNMKFAEIEKAYEDAASRLKEVEDEEASFREAMKPFEPLFIGEPGDETFEAIATRKAIAGSPLAIKFLATFPKV